MNRPDPIFPPALKKGDTIGVIAPSSYYDVTKLESAVHFLKEHGFHVIFHEQTTIKTGQVAGTPEQKVDALHDYFKNPEIKAIFCTCGGNGAIHLLNKIDYNLVKENPKIFIGYSDITILLNAISSQTGLITFHGPTLSSSRRITPYWSNQMIDVLTGNADSIAFESKTSTEGILYGGNLSVMQALIGTPYAPDMTDAILLLEDINDHLSRYDRMIGHMAQAGWLNSLSAIMLGDFLKSQDNPERPFGFTIEEIIANRTFNTPILMDTPIGHGERLCTLPIGANIVLKNNKLSFKSLI